MRACNKKGYTLMELLVTIGLSAVIAAIALPVAPKLVAQYQIRGVTSQIGFELARARMQAVAQNRAVRLRFAEQGGYYFVERSLDDGSFGTTVASVRLPNGVTISTDSADVTFDTRGLADAELTLDITKGDSHLTLSMNILGRVTDS